MKLLSPALVGVLYHLLALLQAVSGFVVICLGTTIKCEECLSATTTIRDFSFKSNINREQRGTYHTDLRYFEDLQRGGGEITSAQIKSSIQLGIRMAVLDGKRDPPLKRALTEEDFMAVSTSTFSPSLKAKSYTFDFNTYAPLAFRSLRVIFGIKPTVFLKSFEKPLRELSNPGASGSIFYLTADDKFIIKTVQPGEGVFLQKLLSGYYNHSLVNEKILLTKFFGFYSYQYKLKTIRIVVMNNLLPSSVTMHQKYDLKGSTFKREASPEEQRKNSPTFKDLDFMKQHPAGLILPDDTYNDLINTIQRDTNFLLSYQIMDYSLLIGVHNSDIGAPSKKAAVTSKPTWKKCIQKVTNRPTGGIPAWNVKNENLLLYIGIIDILQVFGVKKQLEHAGKAALGLGEIVSVIPPSDYAQRFLEFMTNTVFKKHSVHSRNASNVNAIMSEGFFKNNPDFYAAELRNVKTTMRTFTLIESLGVVTKKNSVVHEFGEAEKLPLHSWPLNISEIQSRYDIGMVVSFGNLIPKEVIDALPLGCINVHASLLPRWRGAAPIIHSILAGDTETGVTIMRVHPHRFDVGEIVRQYRVSIARDERAEDLERRLAVQGASLLMECLRDLPNCLQKAQPQPPEGVTYAPKITPDMSCIKWNSTSAQSVYNLHRAISHLYPLKTSWHGHIVKLRSLSVAPNNPSSSNTSSDLGCNSQKSALNFLLNDNKTNLKFENNLSEKSAGVCNFEKDSKSLSVICGDRQKILVSDLQVANKKMKAIDFYNGFMSKRSPHEWKFQP